MYKNIGCDKTKKIIKVLGGVIKRQRILQNKTISFIAGEVLLSKYEWIDTEFGICNDVKLTTLWKIAEGLGMPLSDLIKETAVRLGEDFSLTDLEQ